MVDKIDNSKHYPKNVGERHRYGVLNGRLVLSVNQWLAAGLTEAQFRQDSANGLLRIARRSIRGGTLMYADSIARSERREAIERLMGTPTLEHSDLYELRPQPEAQAFYSGYMSEGGVRLCASSVRLYTARVALFEAMRDGCLREQQVWALQGRAMRKYEWLERMLAWQQSECRREGALLYKVRPYRNVRGWRRHTRSI